MLLEIYDNSRNEVTWNDLACKSVKTLEIELLGLLVGIRNQLIWKSGKTLGIFWLVKTLEIKLLENLGKH